jgi:hypothetical protein
MNKKMNQLNKTIKIKNNIKRNLVKIKIKIKMNYKTTYQVNLIQLNKELQIKHHYNLIINNLINNNQHNIINQYNKDLQLHQIQFNQLHLNNKIINYII